MDQPIRPKTEAEIEAERLAQEQQRAADTLRTWDRLSALSEVVRERQNPPERNDQPTSPNRSV